MFFTVRAGTGVGGGGKYDPKGQSPGYKSDRVKDNLSAALNTFAEADASFGSASFSVGTKAGLHAIDKNKAYIFIEEPGWPNANVSALPKNFHMGAAARVEGTLVIKLPTLIELQ